jgi:hypothetical protein
LSSTPSSVVDVVKQVQYVVESTYGTTPTNPTLINAGAIQDINDTTDLTSKRYRVLGSEDIYKALLCGELYSFELKYTPSTTTFPKLGLDAGQESSLSIVLSYKLNGVENFVVYRGCKTDKISFEYAPEEFTVTQNFICQSISTPNSAHGLGASTTFAATFSGTPLCGSDIGANPFTFNSVTYDCIRFQVAINRNLDARRVLGKLQIAYLVNTVRDIDIDFDLIYVDTTLIADTKTLTQRTASFTFNATGPKTFTFTNMQLEGTKFDLSAESKDLFMRSFSGTAQSVSLTA